MGRPFNMNKLLQEHSDYVDSAEHSVARRRIHGIDVDSISLMLGNAVATCGLVAHP